MLEEKNFQRFFSNKFSKLNWIIDFSDISHKLQSTKVSWWLDATVQWAVQLLSKLGNYREKAGKNRENSCRVWFAIFLVHFIISITKLNHLQLSSLCYISPTFSFNLSYIFPPTERNVIQFNKRDIKNSIKLFFLYFRK